MPIESVPLEQITLRRTLGKTTATILTASMIISTGIFAAIGSATELAGSGLLLAMLIGGVIALATGVSASQLGVNYPKEGGAFTWAKELHHETLSFIAGIAYLGKGIVSIGVISLAFATYTTHFLPSVPIPILAGTILVLVTILNVSGIKLTAHILIVLASLNVLLLAIFVVLSLPAVHIEYLKPIAGNNIFDVLAGAAIFFWTWDGFMRTAIMASEMKNPKQSIPFAIVGGVIIAAVVFLAVAATTLGILGAIKTGNTDRPVLKAAMVSLGNWGGILILSAAWIATVSEMIGDLLSASRVAFAMGKHSDLPRFLGTVDKRFHSLRNAILAFGFLSLILVLLFPNLRSLLSVASVFSITWYEITHFLALRLPKEQRIASPLFSWFGFFGCLLLLFFLPIKSVTIGLTIIFGIALLHKLYAKLRKRKGVILPY